MRRLVVLALAGYVLIGATARADEPPRVEAARAAVRRGLVPILKSVAEYPKHRDCFSCHHQAVPTLALTTARERGFVVDADAIASVVEHTEADLRSALEDYRKGTGQPGGVIRAGYALRTLELGGKGSDEVTSAVAGYLLGRSTPEGHWGNGSNRPPSEASMFTATHLALRGLAAYGDSAMAERIAERRAKALGWLTRTEPKETEDRVFRLFALKEAGAGAEALRAAATDLLEKQNPDGGWAQLDGGDSDAYATGSALAALKLAGGWDAEDPGFSRGIAFLLDSQRPDGTWYVASRSKPFQPYFESGFPYGKDQWISMAASSWAVTALALSAGRPGR